MSPRTAAIVLILVGAMAQTGPALTAEERPGRYTMSPADDGFVRLDTETGEMAFCKRSSDGTWACAPMATKPSLSEPGAPSATAPDLAPPGEESNGKITVPSEQDIDKLFDFVESMMNKLKERLKRLEEKEKAPATPL